MNPELLQQVNAVRRVLVQVFPQQCRQGSVDPSEWHDLHRAAEWLARNAYLLDQAEAENFNDLLLWVQTTVNEMLDWMRQQAAAGRTNNEAANTELRARFVRLWEEYDKRARKLLGRDTAGPPAAAASGRKDALVTRSEPRTHVFVSYSHQDAEWLKRLQIHLKPMIRQGTLDLWDDSKIKPGAAWRDEIDAALSRASAAVLLVSADFLASDFVADRELPLLLDRAASGGVRIMPVIVGSCLFQHHAELSKYQAINSPDLPLTKMQRHEAEETLSKLAQAIAEFIGS